MARGRDQASAAPVGRASASPSPMRQAGTAKQAAELGRAEDVRGLFDDIAAARPSAVAEAGLGALQRSIPGCARAATRGCGGGTPAAAASAEVQAGFAQFQKNCLACHRLNGAGDSQFGPDLNLPHNPTEYLAGDFLRQYIRDPQSLRHWPQGRMPAFSREVLSDQALEQLLAYLRHMATRKARENANAARP